MQKKKLQKKQSDRVILSITREKSRKRKKIKTKVWINIPHIDQTFIE